MLKLKLGYSPIVNFAIQQNHIRLVQTIDIKNTGSTELKNVRVRLAADPAFMQEYLIPVSSIPAGGNVSLDKFDLVFSADYLRGLSERIEGTIKVTVTSEKEEIFSKDYPIAVLPYDQWPGDRAYPELTSAFVTPNHPAVSAILKRASEIIGGWTGNASLEGYQSGDPARVKFLMGAVYEAISEQDIAYCSCPASFEDEGQRIRLADNIFSNKIATCIDIAFLYAGCLEAIALHPIVVMADSHAFSGAWLVDSTFADSVNDDASLLTKRMADGINEVLLVETTGMENGCRTSFDKAVDAAGRRMLDGNDFRLFIDVAKGRSEHIRPLPVLADGTLSANYEDAESALHARPTGFSETAPEVDPYAKDIVDKQTIWERKLLDLSLRNHLLNCRFTGSNIQIMSVDLPAVEDLLAGGATLALDPVPEGAEGTYRNCCRGLTPADGCYQVVRDDLAAKRLRAFLPDDALQGVLTSLYRTCRTTMEENGANTLYLAMGMLKWFDSKNPKKPHYAPLLLIPVEIARRSASSRYYIKGRDEETVFNITLLEMLRQAYHMEIPGLNPLPKDSRGVDVAGILNIVRRCIMDQKGWDVEDTALLGNFSFNKFLMWNDIHNNADVLRANPVVKSLLDGVVDSSVNTDIDEQGDLDGKVAPGDILLPINADSSQLEAIAASLEGKSFIMHGPPGTGKSQSITNIIANAIYRGKRVLFVAEKMAALEVVQKRLEDIGLAPFCLELHSNKARKSAVMDQLKRTVEVMKARPVEQFAAEAERIKAVRDEITGYMDSLHREYPLGVSLYDCLSRFSGYPEECTPFTPDRGWLLSLKKKSFSRLDDTLSQFITACTICGSPKDHPLSGISATKLPSEDIRPMLESLQAGRLQDALRRSQQALFGETDDSYNRRQIEALCAIAKELGESKFISSGLLLLSPDKLNHLEELTDTGRRLDGIAAGITKTYSKRILDASAEEFKARYEQAKSKGAIGSFFALRSLCSELSKYTADGSKPSRGRLPSDIDALLSYKECSDRLGAEKDLLESVCGKTRLASQSRWDDICEGVKSARAINDFLIEIVGRDFPLVSEKKNHLAGALSNGLATFLQYDGHVLGELLDLFRTFTEKLETLRGSLGAEFPDGDEQAWATRSIERVDRWSAHLGDLRDWVTYNRQKALLHKAGLAGLVEAVENGTIRPEDSLTALYKGIYKTYADWIISQDDTLSEFHGLMFEEKIGRFRALCARFEELTRKELFYRMASGLPALQKEASQSSSVGILQKSIRNGCRGVSLRQFFDKIQDILPRICPCMLMSPLSVAQYLDAKGPKFDLVIFDEASQMPTCEAVGAIARGNSIIVAGDPNQMPPTSFFVTDTFDEDNAAIEDLESVLDDCLALSLSSKHLKWHYRSRHESLIAFSNTRYYGNRLLTFPSPDDISTKILYQYIPEGIYERGGARQNRAEAEAIIAEIRSRLTDSSKKGRSIGVITFNTNQQSLIEDMLNDLYKAHPELEKAATDCSEPIFVKNLENVQGDERDVILFSVGYGPDAKGNVTLNFGPLNRDGGWRRLNVAVSRARYEMKVFSTLRSDQIDTTRTAAAGVAGLRSFLEYAERGREALNYNTATSARTDDNVILDIAGELSKAGYHVHANIGCSGYRIDIGVIDSKNSSRYCLGILCDGYNSRSTRTIRDREVVQTGVLTALGWKILRVWTMDWWYDRGKTLSRIIEAIENGGPADEPKVELEPVAEDTADESHSCDSPAAEDPAASAYKEEDSFVTTADIDMFNNGDLDHMIRGKVGAVIETEAPISLDLLNRRIAQAFGFQQVGQKMRRHLSYLYDEKLLLKSTSDGDRRFYWKDSQNPDEFENWREAGSRDALDIAPQEVGAAAISILREQGALMPEDLEKETAKLLGYSRMGDRVSASVYAGIKHLLDSGKAETGQDDKIVGKR